MSGAGRRGAGAGAGRGVGADEATREERLEIPEPGLVTEKKHEFSLSNLITCVNAYMAAAIELSKELARDKGFPEAPSEADFWCPKVTEGIRAGGMQLGKRLNFVNSRGINLEAIIRFDYDPAAPEKAYHINLDWSDGDKIYIPVPFLNEALWTSEEIHPGIFKSLVGAQWTHTEASNPDSVVSMKKEEAAKVLAAMSEDLQTVRSMYENKGKGWQVPLLSASMPFKLELTSALFARKRHTKYTPPLNLGRVFLNWIFIFRLFDFRQMFFGLDGQERC